MWGGGRIAIMEIPTKELRFMTNGYMEAVACKYFNLGQNRNIICLKISNVLRTGSLQTKLNAGLSEQEQEGERSSTK